MNLAKNIEPVTSLKSDSAKLIRKVRESGQPIVITQNGKPTAILMDVESFQRQRDAFALLKILVQGDQDYQNNRTLSHDKAHKHFEDRFARLEKQNVR